MIVYSSSRNREVIDKETNVINWEVGDEDTKTQANQMLSNLKTEVV